MLALKVLAPIELSDQGLYARVPACHVNLYYFLGFSYFMTRRYTDAVHAWVSILAMVEKQSARTASDRQITRKTERMFGLIASSKQSTLAWTQDLGCPECVDAVRAPSALFRGV